MAGQGGLEDLRRRAVELRLQGFRAKEISRLLNSGHSAWTIRKWLRDARLSPTRERVLELSLTRDTHEIAKSLGISKRRVFSILQDAGISDRTRRSTEQNVERLLSDPKRYIAARFTQSWPFGWALLKWCSQEVDRSPVAGLPMVETAITLLGRVERTRRVDSTRRKALCLYILSRGIEAHVYAATNRHMVALGKLQESFDCSGGCIPCEADQLRRLALVYGKLRRWNSAYASLNGSLERYHSLGTNGHDLYGNGIANCLLIKCGLQLVSIGPEAGAIEARNGLMAMTGKESPVLFTNLVFALARCLQPAKDPGEVEESQRLLDWCFDNLELREEPTVARAMIYWLRGLLANVVGKIDEAMEDLTLALEDARVLQLEQDAGSILADLGALNPDPREVRGHIEDFCEWSAAGNLIVPSWLSNLDTEIRAIYEIAVKSRSRIDASLFVALREAGGESRMPAFIIPSQPQPSNFLQYTK